MENKHSFFQIFGADRRELRASFCIAAFGLALVFLFLPPVARASHDPAARYQTVNLLRCALFLVSISVSFLCALNALRDKSNVSEERSIIVVWCGFLCVLQFATASTFLHHLKLIPALWPPWLTAVAAAM